jgi:hypothetical protein
MRWGKTKVAVDFAAAMSMLEQVRNVLVFCPLSVVGVWEDELRRHCPTPWVLVDELGNSYAAGNGEGEYGVEERWDWPVMRWMVMNFDRSYDRWRDPEDGTWFPVPNKQLEEFKADLIIVDESHHIGNPSAVVSKHIYQLGRKARFRLIMTGTMFHRKPFYVFGQFKFLDPSLFGTSFSSFKKKIAVFGGYGGYEVLRYINLSWMMRRIRPWVHIEKYVPPRNAVVNVLRFHLTGSNLSHYVKMEKESIIEVGGEEVISPIVLSRHLRCQQIAGGWIKTDTRYRRVGDDKYKIGTDRIAEYAEQEIDKFVVGCRFIPELRDAATAAKKAGYKVLLLHGGLSKEERTKRIKSFKVTEERCAFISQISAGKEGIDLSAASVMLFWSLPESFVEFDQFRHRIYKFNEKRTLMYDYLVAWGTRDQVTFEAIKRKEDVARFITSNPKLVEKITEHRSLKQ